MQWRIFAARAASWLLASLTLTALIAAVRVEIIASPPYWDHLIGLWPEADWLADHDFDFERLRSEEHHSLDYHGGRRSYLTSILPLFAAILMRALPSPAATFVAYHLFVFFCAGATTLCVGAILARVTPWPTASLAATATLTTPVFATQVDMLGMEIPLAAATVLTLLCFDQRRYVLAAGFSLLACSFKASGLLVTGSLAAAVALRAARARDAKERRAALTGLAFSLVAIALETWSIHWGQTVQPLLRARNPNLFWTVIWAPDLILLGVAGALALLLVRIRRGDSPEVAERFPSTSLLAAAVGALWLGATTQVPFIPRYLTVAVPLLYLAVIPPLAAALPRGWLNGVLGFVVLLNIANWNGAFYPDQFAGMQRLFAISNPPRLEGSFLERSHEYLKAHRATIDAVRAAKQADVPVVAGHLFDYGLTLPRLGYVDEPALVYSTNGLRDAVPLAREVEDLPRDAPREIVFITAPTTFGGLSRFAAPEPTAEDVMLFDSGGEGPIRVYRVNLRGAEDERRAWFASRLFPPPARALRLAWQIRSGDLEAAADEIAADPSLKAIRADLLLRAAESARNEREEAHARGLEATADKLLAVELNARSDALDDEQLPHRAWRRRGGPRLDADDRATLGRLDELFHERGPEAAGELCLSKGWLLPANEYFRFAAALRSSAISGALATMKRAERSLEQGDTPRAEGELDRLAMGPAFASWHRLKGLVASSKGDTRAAARFFEAAHRLSPADPRIRKELDDIRRKRGRPGESAE